MAVTVRLAAPRLEKVSHPDGDDFTIDAAGALIITAREGRGERSVAGWAPGAWVGVEVASDDAAPPA